MNDLTPAVVSFHDSGEMAALVETFDWSSTPLGPMADWSGRLAATVDLILGSPAGMVLLWGRDGVMLYNDGYIPVAGARHPVALGKSARLIWPEIWDWNKHIIDQAFLGRSMTFREQPMIVRRNGVPENVWFDLYYTPVRDQFGVVAGVICTVIEMTARVAAAERARDSELRLVRSEARLSALINQASIGIVQSNLTDCLVAVNERFSTIVGQPEAVLVDRTFAELTHPDDLQASQSLIDSLIESGRSFTAEQRLLRGDGSNVWVSVHASLARDQEDRPDFIVRVVHDITDRKDAEARAQESNEQIELALGTGVLLGSWSWNIPADRVTGDSRFARSFSLRPEQARVGVPIALAVTAIHPDDRAHLQDAIESCLRDGGSFQSEYRLRQNNGAWLWVEAHGHCERDASGTPFRFPGVLINIGQRRAAAQRQAFLIALGDQLRTLDQPDVIMARIVEATALKLQATRVGYGEASPDGRSVDLLAGWNSEGDPELGRIDTASFGAPAAEALHRDEAVLTAVRPTRTAPGSSAPVLAVPLFRDGRWHAMMYAVAADARPWTNADADLLREVIGRTWEAVERARAVLTLRRAQTRQAFLLRLNDHLSELHDPEEVIETVASSLGSFLKVSRAAYGEVNASEKTIKFHRSWKATSEPTFKSTFAFNGLFDAEMEQLARGLTVTEDDFQTRERPRATVDVLLARTGTRAVLAVPIIRDGSLRAGLFLSQTEPRRWSLEEISLTQEVARRTWDALERTRAEEALQLSEARLRAMFDTLPVGIIFAEMPSGRVTEGNARVEQILGYSILSAPDDARFADWVAFDEDGQRVAIEDHPLFIAITTGEVATRVFHHERGDGSRVWVSVIGAPVRDPDRRITGGLVTIVDVDREKRAEEALRELNATLEHQVDLRTRERDRVWRNSRDLLAAMNLDGSLEAVNPSWTTLLGWPADALVGQPFAQFIHADDVEPTFAAIESLKHASLNAPFENRYRSKDGTFRWFSWIASLYGDTVYANGRDVTAEKKQAEALRQAEEQLRQSQKMEAVGQLTGGIAHDFNNLLTGITGALDLLAKRIEQGRLETTGRYIDMAMNSANRAASLTHRLLAFSRRQPLEARSVDANTLVVSMEDLLRRTLGETIMLEIVANGSCLALCDPHQLENALLNLVINARDAMPDGGRLMIETSGLTLDSAAAREAGVSPGDYAVLAVSDTGTGMTADVIARAFDPFFTTKPIGQGTGLGLSMIYGFAKQSDGTVRIESEVDKGTTVRLYLPRALADVAALPQIVREPPRSLDGETVMIVEDDPTVRKLVLEVLRDLGYRTIEAEDGLAGLRLLDTADTIDLLVTDVGLPGLNGRQLADRARQLRPGLKVLFITGYAENATFGGDYLDRGMQMITKPFAVNALATKIKDMIDLP